MDSLLPISITERAFVVNIEMSNVQFFVQRGVRSECNMNMCLILGSLTICYSRLHYHYYYYYYQYRLNPGLVAESHPVKRTLVRNIYLFYLLLIFLKSQLPLLPISLYLHTYKHKVIIAYSNININTNIND